MLKLRFTFNLLPLTLFLVLGIFSQNLTVKDIMREPSIAGMRAEGEKLSPDGSKVVFLWNAEGKEPKDLYLWDGNGEAKIIVRPQDLLSANPTPTPENKLNYGLIVRDDFAKSRENQLGNLEWSPDSTKILFSQNGDIYVLSTELTKILQEKKDKFERQILLRADLVSTLIRTLRAANVNDEVLFDQLQHSRLQTLAMLNEMADGEIKYDENSEYERAISLLKNLPTLFPQLSTNEVFLQRLGNLKQFERQAKIAQIDYNNSIKSSLIPPKRLTKTQTPEFSARWLDNKRILFQQNGNLFSIDTENVSLIQLSKEANPTAFISVSNAVPTKDGNLVTYTVSDSSKQRTLFVPNYLDEFVQAPTFRRGWSDQKILVVETTGNRENPFEIKLPKAEGLGYLRSIKWAADNASLIVDRIDKDTKRRQIFYVNNVGSKAEQTILVTEERDEKWIAPLSRIVEPNPKDDSQILFASEKDGFNHLYLVTLERRKPEPNPTGEVRQENLTDAGFTAKVDIKQLTSGKFEVDWAKWSNSERIIFSSTEEKTSERQIYQIILPTITKSKILFGQAGFKSNFQTSDSGESVTKYIYSLSKWNEPNEIFMSSSCNVKCEQVAPQQITKTTPQSFLQTKWNEPKFVDIPTRDGKLIKSKVYLPSNFGDNSAKRIYPMVIFVHGAGYLQNTINGWNNYYREFMFNQMLTQQGYVVLDIDYRGSAGYGRDWRTDVYDFLGGKDYEDHLDAIDYAVKNYAVNPKKIGVYGGSYGGFMAEMLAFRTDKITCAAALRPVADWKNYYASSNVYTAERLGFPDKNPEGYKRSSPISYAEGLNKPLLILHGMVDDNVHAQDSVQLIEKLMRLEKTNYFEAMLYPSENHGFTRPSSWTDEYERILNFFNKHLR
jgi:dipeptidyl aminopeptidase/acylaminoacyl peptidase